MPGRGRGTPGRGRGTKNQGASKADSDESRQSTPPSPALTPAILNARLIDAIRTDSVAEALGKALLGNHNVMDELCKALTPFIQLTIDETVKAKIDKLTNDNNILQSTVSKLSDENKKLINEVNANKQYLEELDRQHRGANLIIRGVPEQSMAERASTDGGEAALPNESHTSVENTVIEFARRELNVNIENKDIVAAYRTRKNAKEKIRPILIRFANLKIRGEILRTRKELKDKQNNTIYISEQLTKYASDLFYKTRKLVKNNIIQSTWTRNGLVYIRKSSNGDPLLIRSDNDLPKSAPSEINAIFHDGLLV